MRKKKWRIFFMVWTLLNSLNISAQEFGVEIVLDALPVHPEGDRNVFATSFDYRDGQLFVVQVEPVKSDAENGINLRTVIRKGVRQNDASWQWDEAILEPRTLLDPWHTQASIGLDKYGYIHVAYNMHNMPWQYAVSRKPYDISNFEFRGQPVTDKDLRAVKFDNKSPFPDAGTADIPGNQVTYPMFFIDRKRNLYVTYRYAIKPARPWESRAFAGGVARYDAERRHWEPVGGNVAIGFEDARLPDKKKTATQKPFAFSEGYTVYLPTIAFDVDNGMHIFWNWRKEQAGMETIHPSYAYSPDGEKFFDMSGRPYSMPISIISTQSVFGSDNQQFYAPKSVAVTPQKNPLAVFQPISGGRELVIVDRLNGSVRTEKTPDAAQNILVDRLGRQWLFATGIKVFMREAENMSWRFMGKIGSDLCFPKVKYYPEESRFVLHAKSCTSMAVSVFTFRR